MCLPSCILTIRISPKPLPDTVETQGRYLLPRPRTPVYTGPADPNFAKMLHISLNSLLLVQKWRRDRYGAQDAEEWPISHTPGEVKEVYREKQKRRQEALEALTYSESDETPDSEIFWKPESPTDRDVQLRGNSGRTPGIPSTPPSLSDGRSESPGCLNRQQKITAQPRTPHGAGQKLSCGLFSTSHQDCSLPTIFSLRCQHSWADVIRPAKRRFSDSDARPIQKKARVACQR